MIMQIGDGSAYEFFGVPAKLYRALRAAAHHRYLSASESERSEGEGADSLGLSQPVRRRLGGPYFFTA